MTLLDPPLERRLGTIEQDLASIKIDLAKIQTRLDNLPTRWMFWVLLFTTTIPIYGILVTLLWQTVK